MDYRKTWIRLDSFAKMAPSVLQRQGVDILTPLTDARSVYLALRCLFTEPKLGGGLFVILDERRVMQLVYLVAGLTPDQAYVNDWVEFTKPLVGQRVLYCHYRDDYFCPESTQDAPLDYMLRQFLMPERIDYLFAHNLRHQVPDLTVCLLHQLGCTYYLPTTALDIYWPTVPSTDYEAHKQTIRNYLLQSGLAELATEAV